jgi:hypothetical protein
MADSDTKFSYVLNLTEDETGEKTVMPMIFYPTNENSINEVKRYDRDSVPDIQDKVDKKIAQLEGMGFKIKDNKVTVINNFIAPDDTIAEVKQKIGRILNVNPMDLCIFCRNEKLDQQKSLVDPTIWDVLSEQEYVFLENSFHLYKRTNNELVEQHKINLNGNPYTTNRKDAVIDLILKELRRTEPSEIIGVTNHSKRLLLPMMGHIPESSGKELEVFVVERNSFGDQTVVPIYWHQAYSTRLKSRKSIVPLAPNDGSAKLLFREHKLLQGKQDFKFEPFDNSETKFSADISSFERNFCQSASPSEMEVTVMSGFTSGLMLSINPTTDTTREIDLSEIFGGIKTSPQIPFIKFNTGIPRSLYEVSEPPTLSDVNKKIKALLDEQKKIREADPNKNLSVAKQRKLKEYEGRKHSWESSDLFPGDKERDKMEEKVQYIMYNRIYKNFIKDSKNHAKVSDWTNTNRRIHAKDVKLNEYHTYTEKALIFQLLIKDQDERETYLSVNLKSDGTAFAVLNWNEYSSARFLAKIVNEIHLLLKKIKCISPALNVLNYDFQLASEMVEVQSGEDALFQWGRFNQYLESIGVNITNFDYVCDFKWHESAKLKKEFDDDFRQRFLSHVKEIYADEKQNKQQDKQKYKISDKSSEPETLDKSKLGYVSTPERKILFYKKIDNYVNPIKEKGDGDGDGDDTTTKTTRGRKKEMTKREGDADRFNTLLIYSLSQIGNNCMRVTLANVHNLSDLYYIVDFVKKTLQFYLQSERGPAEDDTTDGDDEQVIVIEAADYQIPYLSIFQQKASKEEERLMRSDYKNALKQVYPKGIIQSILAPEIFDPSMQISRTHDPSKQSFGITYFRYLIRLGWILETLRSSVSGINKKIGDDQTRTKGCLQQITSSIDQIIESMKDYANDLSQENKKDHTNDSPQENKSATLAKKTDEHLLKILNNLFKSYRTIQSTLEPKEPASDDRNSHSKPSSSMPSALKLLNKMAYLLLLYFYGFEYHGIFWMCIPVPEEYVDKKSDRFCFEGKMVREGDKEIWESESEPLFRNKVYHYNDDNIQYKPNTNHKLANTFLEQVVTECDGKIENIYNLFKKGKKQFWMGFHSRQDTGDYFIPKCFGKIRGSTGDYGSFFKQRQKILESYRSNKKDVSKKQTASSQHAPHVYKNNLSEKDVGTHSHLPPALIKHLGSEEYRVLYNNYKFIPSSFLRPFSYLAFHQKHPNTQIVRDNAHVAKEQTEDNGDAMIRHLIVDFLKEPKHEHLYYSFKEGVLPGVFGTLKRFEEFLNHSYLNEDFLWDIIGYPGVITRDGFNLFVIVAVSENDIKVKLPVTYQLHKIYDRKKPSLVVLKNSFGYHLIFKVGQHQAETWFLDSNDHLIKALFQTVFNRNNKSAELKVEVNQETVFANRDQFVPINASEPRSLMGKPNGQWELADAGQIRYIGSQKGQFDVLASVTHDATKGLQVALEKNGQVFHQVESRGGSIDTQTSITLSTNDLIELKVCPMDQTRSIGIQRFALSLTESLPETHVNSDIVQEVITFINEHIDSSNGRLDISSVLTNELDKVSQLLIDFNVDSSRFQVYWPVHPGSSSIQREGDKRTHGSLLSRDFEWEDLPTFQHFLKAYGYLLLSSSKPLPIESRESKRLRKMMVSDYSIDKWLALPTVGSGSRQIIGARFKNNLNIYFKTIDHAMLKPEVGRELGNTRLYLELSKVEILEDQWQSIWFDHILVKKYDKHKLFPKLYDGIGQVAFRLYSRIKDEFSRYLQNNMRAKSSIKLVIDDMRLRGVGEDDEQPLSDLLGEIVDKVYEFRSMDSFDEKENPIEGTENIYSLGEIHRVMEENTEDPVIKSCLDVKETDDQIVCDRNGDLVINLKDSYRLLVPQELFSREDIIKVLSDELLNNNFLSTYMEFLPAREGVKQSTLDIEFEEFLLDNDNTKALLYTMDSFIEEKFINCQLRNEYLSGVRITTDLTSPILFHKQSSFRPISVDIKGKPVEHLFYENDILKPNDPNSMFQLFCDNLTIVRTKTEIFDQIIDYLSKDKVMYRIYYQYLRIIYEFYLSKYKIKIDDQLIDYFPRTSKVKADGKTSREGEKRKESISILFNKTDQTSSSTDKKMELSLFLRKYHYPIDIDYFLVAKIYKKNLIVIKAEGRDTTIHLFNYNVSEEWYIFYQQEYQLYPVALIEPKRGGSLQLKEQMVKKESITYRFKGHLLQEMGFDQMIHIYEQPFTFIIRTLKLYHEQYAIVKSILLNEDPETSSKLEEPPRHSKIFKRTPVAKQKKLLVITRTQNKVKIGSKRDRDVEELVADQDDQVIEHQKLDYSEEIGVDEPVKIKRATALTRDLERQIIHDLKSMGRASLEKLGDDEKSRVQEITKKYSDTCDENCQDKLIREALKQIKLEEVVGADQEQVTDEVKPPKPRPKLAEDKVDRPKKPKPKPKPKPAELEEVIDDEEPVTTKPLRTDEVIDDEEPVTTKPLRTDEVIDDEEPVTTKPLRTDEVIDDEEPVTTKPLRTDEVIDDDRPVTTKPLRTDEVIVDDRPVTSKPMEGLDRSQERRLLNELKTIGETKLKILLGAAKRPVDEREQYENRMKEIVGKYLPKSSKEERHRLMRLALDQLKLENEEIKE